MLFPDFDLVEPLFVCNAFRDDAAGPAPVVECRNLRDIFACGLAQCEWLRPVLFRFGDQRNGGSASIFQFESIFIAELAIEVGDAGNRLDKISFGLAAFVDHLEETANESTIAICWIGGNHLRTTNTEGDALVGPRVFPQAGAGHRRVPFLACVLDQAEIIWPHEGMIAVHQPVHDHYGVGIGWFLGFITKNYTVQCRDPLSIFGC